MYSSGVFLTAIIISFILYVYYITQAQAKTAQIMKGVFIMTMLLKQYFTAEHEALNTAEQKAKKARIQATITAKTAKKPETIRKYNQLAEQAEKSFFECKTWFNDVFLHSDDYKFFDIAFKMAKKAVKKLSTCNGLGADLAREISNHNFNHDIFNNAVISLAGEIWLHSDKFLTNYDDGFFADNDEQYQKHDIDFQWLGITFNDYVFVPYDRGEKKGVCRWVSPTKNYLCGYVNRYLRSSGDTFMACGIVDENIFDNTVDMTAEFTQAIHNNMVFDDFLSTVTNDNQTLIKLYQKGYKDKEIAEIMNISKQAISNKWVRLAEKYRKWLNTAYC